MAMPSMPAANINGAHDGEVHLFNPQTVHKLQQAVSHGQLQDLQGILGAGQRPDRSNMCTLRGLLGF